MNIKTKIVAALALALLVAPGISMAQTMSVAQMQAQIVTLEAQLQMLQAQLNARIGGGTTKPPIICPVSGCNGPAPVPTSTPVTIGTPSITLTYPTGGEILDNGGKANIATIKWTTQNFGKSNVEVDILGKDGVAIRQYANLPNTGSYVWASDSTLASGSYKVSVYPNNLGPEPPDATSGLFTVNTDITPVPLLTIIQPITGDGYTVNQPIPIFWTQNYVSDATVVYLYKIVTGGGAGEYTSPSIATIAQDNTFTIPASFIGSAGQYFVAVCDSALTNIVEGSCVKSDIFNVANPPTAGGALTGSLSAATPQSSFVGMGTTRVELAQYQFIANASGNETLTQLNITDSSSALTLATSTDQGTFINYQLTDASGNVLAATSENSNGVLQFNLTGLNIPANTTQYLNLYADVNSYPYAKSGGTHAYDLTSYNYTNASVATTTNVSLTSGMGNLFTVYQTTLNVAGAPFNNPNSVSAVGNIVGEFNFTAGGGNINPTVKALMLSTVGSVIQASTVQTLGLYDAGAPSVLLASATVTGTNNATFNLSSLNPNQWVIPGFTSKTLLVKVLSAPTSLAGVNNGNYQALLVGVTWTDGVTPSITSLSPTISIPVPSQYITGLSTASTTPTITVLTPNGGEILTSGTNYNITYTSSYSGGIEPETGFGLYQGNTLLGYPVVSYVSPDVYSWKVPQYQVNGSSTVTTLNAAPGSNYFIKVYMASNLPGGLSDKSNAPFSIVAAPASTTPSITVLSPNGGEVWHVGETHTITWNTSNLPANTTVGLQLSYQLTNGITYEDVIASNLSATGSYQWTIPSKYGTGMNSSAFKMRAILYGPSIPGTNGPEDYSNAPFTITNVVVAPVPTVTLSANPTTIIAGSSTTLTWSSTNATSCTGTSAGSSWTANGTSTSLSAAGSKVITPVNNPGLLPYAIVYNITCVGSGGTTKPASVTVSVLTPPLGPKSPASSSAASSSAKTAIIFQALQNFSSGIGAFFKSL